MRIAIDIRRINEFGTGTYTRNAIRTLARLDHENEYFLLGIPGKLSGIEELPANFHTIPTHPNEFSLASYLELHRILKINGCDLLHVPHLFWKPQGIPCPYVVTVHDLLDHMYRASTGSDLKRSMHFVLTKRVLLRAARIFAVSHFSKKDTESYFKVPGEKIEVIYNALDDRFKRGHADQADREFIAQRYQVNYPFLLYAGRISPHKNVVRIIEAFSLLKNQLVEEGRFHDLRLIVIGDEVSRHPDLRRAVIPEPHAERGALPGVRAHRGSAHLLRPSEDIRISFPCTESFGLPPLEAMAHGTPVVTSNTSAIPEVVGNAAVMVNPENVFDIQRALYRVLLDQNLREKLKCRGVEQAQKFSWEESVSRMLRVYHEVAHS